MTADDIALTLQKGLGVKGAIHLLACMGDAAGVYAATESDLVEMAGLRKDIAREIIGKTAHRQAGNELKFMRRNSISALASTDDEYPALLRECPDYPHVIYYMGDPTLFGGRMLSVVGTREATSYGQRMCDMLIGRLSEIEPETVIVSGLAYGIDSHAHHAALRYGLRTVAVIANPLPGVTPASQRGLALDIVAHGGAIVTELHSQTKQNGSFFIPRNRIISGIGEGTVVVESPASGGSLSTAALADGYGRVVMAVPGRADDRNSAGANRLVMERRAAMACSGDDIVRELGWDIKKPGVIPVRKQDAVVLDADGKLLVQCFREGEAADMETLAVRSGISAGRLAAHLVELELSGIIRSLPGKRYEMN